MGEPAACASLFDARVNQSGRRPGLPCDRQGGSFPQVGQREERIGVRREPSRAAVAEEAAAAAAPARTCSARASPGALHRYELRGPREPGPEWTKQDGRDLSLVLEREVLASAQCHLGGLEEHGGSQLPAG